MFIETRYGNCFHYPLEGLSETSNNQALLIPFIINIKLKAYMRVEVGDTLPWGRFPPLPQANIDYVHRDEIGEIVSSILLKGFQKLQITRLFSITFIIGRGGGNTLSRGRVSPLPKINSDSVHRDDIGEIVSSILLKGF